MRWMRWLMLLLLLPWLIWQGYDFYRNLMMAELSDKGIEFAHLSQAYIVSDTEWTEFTLSKNKPVIRVLSNASLRPEYSVLPDKVWKYAFQYQLLSASGELLFEHVYHHRSRPAYQLETAEGEFETRFFYQESVGLEPTDGRVMMINLAGLDDEVASVRLRLAQKEPQIVDTVVRVYESDTVSTHKLAYQWQRMNESKRAFVARGSVYEPELLSAAEKRNLVKDRWRPIGPKGIVNHDYQLRPIYTLRDYDGEIQHTWGGDILPAGLLIDPWVHAVIPLPEAGGRVTLELQPQGERPLLQPIQLSWYGKGLGNRNEKSLSHNGQPFEYSAQFEGGLLELKAQQLVVVRAYLDTATGRQEITPEPIYLRSYTSVANQPLDFHVDRFGKRASPMRLDLRIAMSNLGAPLEGAAGVRYQLLDDKGVAVDEGRLATAQQFSHYDRLLGADSGYLSQVQRYFFNLPAQVKTVRLFSVTPVMVVAYSRPYDLVHRIRVPEDSYADLSGEAGQPAWFVVHPDNEHELRATHRSRLLRLQTRPPQDDPLVMAGQFEWESYQPQGEWAARYLLNPRDVNMPLRDQSLSVIYRQLKVGQSSDIKFKSEQYIKQVRPSLIFLRVSDEPFQLRVYLDDTLIHREQLRSRRGEVKLPVITTGKHRLRIEAPPQSDWFINYAGQAQGSVIKRLAHRIDLDGLSFVYQKQSHDDEVLSVHFQAPAGQTGRSRLAVSVAAQGRERLRPYDGWTLDRRLFDLRPQSKTQQAVLNTQSQWVEAGQRFFIPLGRDLPPGSYQIDFRLESSNQGYLVLSRLSRGLKESLKTFKEHLFSDAEFTP